MNCDDVVRLTRHHPNGNGFVDCLVAQPKLNQVNESLLAFCVFFVIRRRHAEFLRGGRTDVSNVVPGDFGERLWQFLQPAVIREAAVVD